MMSDAETTILRKNANAVGYVRVSTVGQAVDGVSLEAQRARIQAYCLAHGFTLGALHVDAGISGKRMDTRPGLQAAIAEACRRKAPLVVYSLSRLARSTKDAIAISERLDKAGADLVSLSENIDTTSAAGKMVFRMLAVLAEFERDLVSERTKTALAHLKSKGRRVSGKIPFGFDLDADGKGLVPNPEEQAALALIRQLRAEGKSLRQIGRELESRGIKTKEGRSRWASNTIRQLLLAA